MNYDKTQEILNRLDELLTLIKIGESEVKNAIAYNNKYHGIGLSIDVPELQEARDTDIHEFNDLKHSL